MSISAANGIENCKLCVVFIFIDTKKKFLRVEFEHSIAEYDRMVFFDSSSSEIR